ncbi:hypothetical protein Lal_00021689 [Lupinus albus]|nr:hypothetical protein Lal_00021689 [Lupinus albus]
MLARRAHELCYNCDEKYITGHHCKPQQFLLLQIEDPNDTYHNNEHISAVQNNDCWPTIANPNLGIEGIQKGEENFKKYNLKDKVVFQGLGNVGPSEPNKIVDDGTSRSKRIIQPPIKFKDYG